jgi:membrane associated rhomboid family serine protease
MSEAPSVGVPVCYRHPGRETYVRCTRCNRPICPDCMRDAAVGHQCPDCVAEGRRTQRPARTAFGGSGAGRRGYVTITLIAINVVMLLLSLISARNTNALGGGGWGGLLGTDTPLLRWGAVLGDARMPPDGALRGVAEGEYYRLITAMFLHYGLLHLAMNMWVLWVLGRPLETMLGPLRFLALYLLAGLGGDVSSYLFSKPNVLSAGASGAIFGLFGALFFTLRKLRLDTSSVLPILVINIVFTFSVPGISIAAHMGGLVTGSIIGAGLAYAPRANRTAVQAGVLVAVLAVLGVLTVWQTGQLAAL